MITQTMPALGIPRGFVTITSYGILHGKPPGGHGYTLDVSEILRNPHEDETMRYLDAYDPKVYTHVMETPGALDLAHNTTARLLALVQLDDGEPVNALIYCRGGRHRSAALAWCIADQLSHEGITVELIHRDIDKDVVQPV